MNQKKLYSFDIFDTLITRTVANPDGIFLLIENKLKEKDEFKNFSSTLKNNFSEIRKETEMFSRSNKYLTEGKFDCTFDDIYEVIKNNFNLSSEETEKLKELEIETEFENSLPVEKNIERVKNLILSGEKVVLISDMYLSSETVRKFLVKADEIFRDIEIFTSGDREKLKVDGLLYKVVKEKYPDYELFHFGDNKISDYLVPKFNRIKTKKFSLEPFKRYESIALQRNRNFYTELSVGISRYLRSLNNQNLSYILGCSFAAPILYTYVFWVIEQAEKDNKEHLYFVARDGFVLKIIADEIIKQTKNNIKTHYFYSSRIANRIIDENNLEENLNYFWFALKNKINIEFLAKILNISSSDLEQETDLKINDKKIFSQKEFDSIFKQIRKNEKLKSLIFENNKYKKEIFIKYLKQEIDLSKDNFAFVELNGTGITQDNICDFICQNSNLKRISSFFLVSLPYMKQKENSTKRFYYYPGEFLADYLELLCRTEHGQTIGYREENGKIVPVLETEENEAMIKWGFKDYIEGVKQYSKMFSEYIVKNNINSSDSKFFACYFDYFRYNLDKETKKKISQIPFLIFGDEKNAKSSLPTHHLLSVFSDKVVFKHFLARKFHSFGTKCLLLVIIFLNSKNIKTKQIREFYSLYYRFFMR